MSILVSYFLNAVAFLQVEEIIAQAAKHFGVANATAMWPVITLAWKSRSNPRMQ